MNNSIGVKDFKAIKKQQHLKRTRQAIEDRDKDAERAKSLPPSEMTQLESQFLNAFEEVTSRHKKLINRLLYKGLGSYINGQSNIADKFHADFLSDTNKLLKKQFANNASKHARVKLIRFKETRHLLNTEQESNSSIFKYMQEAVNTYCRKRRKQKILQVNASGTNSSTTNAAPQSDDNEICQNDWMSKKALKSIEKSGLSEEAEFEIRRYLLKNNICEVSAEIFVCRLQGISFVDMAKYDNNFDAKGRPRESGYRKRYNRLIANPALKTKTFQELLYPEK